MGTNFIPRRPRHQRIIARSEMDLNCRCSCSAELHGAACRIVCHALVKMRRVCGLHPKSLGLVESWEATIDMLQGILDADLAAPVLWDSRKSMFRNSARSGDFAGRDIVNRLRQDPPIWTQITQYLETENQLYAEALIAHAATCVAVLGRRCTVSESFVPSINDTLLAPHFLEPALINDVARTAQGKQPARLLSLVRANATIHDASSRSLERPLELKRRRPLPLGFDS